MKNYMGFKMVKAEPMTRGEFTKAKGFELEQGKDPSEEGYKVVYSDNYFSWSPKDVFDSAYMEVVGNPELPSEISISQEMVDNFIATTDAIVIGDRTLVVHAVLMNGFTITEASSCVDPENFSADIGAEICMQKIKDKIWAYLGFLLQTAANGVDSFGVKRGLVPAQEELTENENNNVVEEMEE